jgi:6-pyruvoyltetrahydropterin/6-carboxytetrahydropterin synthase
MFTLSVRDHLMIAHSFRGAVFGPAQRLHGATYVIDAEFRRATLDADGLVVDIGLASVALKAVVAELNYRNLDEVPEFSGLNTTTEFLAQRLHGRLCQRIATGDLGPSSQGLHSLRIVLHESHLAWAAYDASIGG